jgi:hypothetical protein
MDVQAQASVCGTDTEMRRIVSLKKNRLIITQEVKLANKCVLGTTSMTFYMRPTDDLEL